jgi:mannose-6-phosphate isomerase
MEGNALLVYPDGEMQVHMGDSMLLPAKLGSYCMKGTFSALRSWVP